MKTKTFLVLFVLWIPKILCAKEPAKDNYYTVDDWNETIRRMQGFDEIRMTVANQTVQVPKKVTADGIEYEKRIEYDVPIFLAQNIKDSDDFLQLLKFKPGTEKSAHGCYGLFNLLFYEKGRLVGVLHYAHGRYWSPILDSSQLAINLWLERRGFPIHATLKKDILSTK